MSDDVRVLAGRYRLVSVLGRGGMGQVWLAEDEVLHRQVAVKEIRIPSDLPAAERDVLLERTMREARLTARLSHPGIITVYDVVSVDGQPYIVMELVRAPSLAAAIDMEGPLPPQRVAQIGVRLLDALATAHAKGVVHRDVKPSNVLLDGDRVVLSDFGIATSSTDPTLTTTGMVVGSPTYMSPERLRSEGAGPAGDLWSLGATLYAALQGHPPFRADNVMGTITAVVADPPAPPAVHGPLREAVLGLLDKTPEQRLDNAQARSLLEQAVASPPSREPSTTEQPALADLPVMAPAASPTPAATPPTPRDPAPARAATPPVAPAPGADPDPTPDPIVRWHKRPADSAAPAASVGSGSPADRSGARRLPRTKVLLAAAVAVVVVVAAVTAAVVLSRPDDGATSTDSGTGSGSVTTDPEPTSDPKASETDEPPAGQQLPAGYRLVRDPLDFTVAVPTGWGRRLDGATRVDYVSPDGSRFLRIDQVAEAGADAEQAWLDAEPSVADSLSGYDRLRIEPVDYRRWEAADWEFAWEGDSGTVRVLNRGFITDPRGFALYMSGPDSTWEEESLPVFETAAETFEPSA